MTNTKCDEPIDLIRWFVNRLRRTHLKWRPLTDAEKEDSEDAARQHGFDVDRCRTLLVDDDNEKHAKLFKAIDELLVEQAGITIIDYGEPERKPEPIAQWMDRIEARLASVPRNDRDELAIKLRRAIARTCPRLLDEMADGKPPKLAMQRVDWIVSVTTGKLTADALNKAVDDRRLHNSEQRGGRWYYDVNEVAALWPEHRYALIRAHNTGYTVPKKKRKKPEQAGTRRKV